MSSPQKKIDTSYEYEKIARERLLWVVKPIFTVCLVMWTVNPSTTRGDNLYPNILLGFLLGAIFGLFVKRDVLTYYLITRRKQATQQKNRVPEEYYFGKIKEIRQKEGEAVG